MLRSVIKNTCPALLILLFGGCASDSDTYQTVENKQPYKSISRYPAPANSNNAYSTGQFGKSDGFSSSRYPGGSSYTANGISGDFSYSPRVRDFIQNMVYKHGFDEEYLLNIFSHANRLQSVINLENPPPHPSGPTRPGSWSRYRSKFLTDGHIDHGVQFWMENASTVQKASQTYGVDPEYIVAIIGVETYFGRNTGKTRIIDALSTLAFETQRRAKYFTSELEHFLLMAREEGYDPLEPTGSWAGAMGLGQFMPSSFRSLAVDFDHNGRRDLWHSNDAIGSVAHYFAKNGWRYNEPVTEPAYGNNDSSTISLSTYSGNEYWRVYHNFKVIKRYNNSDKYAMAVHQLAQAIKQRYY